jgi:hypothetical protein
MEPMDIPPTTETPAGAPDDAHGKAALLLVESLIHGLTARSVLSVAEAVSIMEVALDAQIAITDDTARPTASMRKATALLTSLVASLKIDLTDEPEPDSEPGEN